VRKKKEKKTEDKPTQPGPIRGNEKKKNNLGHAKRDFGEQLGECSRGGKREMNGRECESKKTKQGGPYW